ncbi:MAG: TRAP transporter permease [Deltaproteobacteria bacterium]|nr:TRAP transporter permease [Deltaproteobacteria bacterium]
MVDSPAYKTFLKPSPLVAIAWSIFQIYAVLVGFLHTLILYPIHVTFAVTLVFLNYPTFKEGQTSKVLDALLAVFTFAIGIYLILNFQRFSTRIPFVHSATAWDIFLGISLVILLLEACRRTVGLSLTVIAILFIVYGFAGKYMPGLLAHRGLSVERFVDLQVLSPNGIFGLPIGVSAELVFYFILFGAFLERSGGGELFSDLAYSVTGRFRGGAAKTSVVSSALYGTISGSAVANVVVDGMITIPLMKRSGFNPAFASAVEAVASTGGQIMPPVMGAAAFILAQIVGVSYWEVAIAAAIPACLYYVALYFAIDFESVKRGLLGLSKAELPDVKTGLKLRIHLLIPLAIMVYYIISGEVTPVTAAFRAILVTVAISFLRKATRMGPPRLLAALEKGGKEAGSVAVPCAVAGVVIGVVINSGLGLKFTDLMIYFSGGVLIITLILVMVAVIILGMGMPTSAAYLLAAILMAPALINLGVAPLAAHMFIFYFAVISMITPPVALAAYAAASIGEADLWETGIAAFKIAIPGFLIPFIFVYDNGLLLKGPWLEIVWRTLITIIGIIGLAGSIMGYYARRTTLFDRVLLFIGSILLILPEKITDFIGLAILAGLFFLQRHREPVRQR